MKPLLFLVAFIFSGLVFTQDIEEREDIATFNSKNINRLEIREPFYQIAVKGCTDFKPAQFDGGIPAFKNLLSKYMYEYLNSDLYRLNGDFSFLITINDKGQITEVIGSPKVENSRYFFDDMEYVFRRIKNLWNPAKCNGKSIASQVKINIRFSSMTVEVDN